MTEALLSYAPQQPLEGAAGRLERFPRAFFHDAAVIQDDEFVGFANRGEAMRNHDGRPATRRVHERLLHQLFRHRVEVRRGFVQNEDGRIADHGTLRENIVYGCATATDASIRRAVDVANLSDVVAQMPNGLDTLVGERGAMVSGGQRQRIAIARAVIRDPSILILDEATSHLDAVSEQLVQQALVNASRGRTTIVIAHRLSTIREADKLIVFDHGRIVEEGTWEALEAAGGAFQRLLRSV